MAIDSQHPLYKELVPDYVQMYDTLKGERQVKSKGQTYLPPTGGMVRDGMKNVTDLGFQAYQAYLTRAVYHDILSDAIEGLLGIMHRQPAKIELPEAMKPLIDNATTEGESLQLLLMKMNKAQLEYGRIGLLAEVPDGQGPSALPYIATYSAVRIINWDAGERGQGKQRLEIVVLDESEFERVGSLEWNEERKFRVLSMSDIVAGVSNEDQSAPASGQYVVATVTDPNGNMPPATAFVTPSLAGKTFGEIPFCFVNTKDLVPAPVAPPMLGVSNLCLAIYRGEADYRQALFAQAQETLVIIGAGETEGEPTRLGTGATLNVPLGGDAKYIGVDGKGLAEMRQALEADKAVAVQRGARLVTAKGGDRQSGEALRVRVAAQTATLTIMAKAAAAGLEWTLKQIATIKGLNPDEVKVEANLDFSDDELTGRDLLEYMQAKQMGAPISLKSIHEVMKERGVTKMDFETELGEIEGEPSLAPAVPTRGVGAGANGGLGGNSNNKDPKARPSN